MEEDTKNDTHTVISSTVNKENTNKKKKFFLTKLRHGEYSLSVTFWCFGIISGFVFKILFDVLLNFSKVAFIFSKIKEYPTIIIFLQVILYYYSICVLIGTWRAANKYNGPKIWKVIAKIFVCIWLIQLAYFTIEYSKVSHKLYLDMFHTCKEKPISKEEALLLGVENFKKKLPIKIQNNFTFFDIKHSKKGGVTVLTYSINISSPKKENKSLQNNNNKNDAERISFARRASRDLGIPEQWVRGDLARIEREMAARRIESKRYLRQWAQEHPWDKDSLIKGYGHTGKHELDNAGFKENGSKNTTDNIQPMIDKKTFIEKYLCPASEQLLKLNIGIESIFFTNYEKELFRIYIDKYTCQEQKSNQ